jgi:type I restriction enzyme S subunit
MSFPRYSTYKDSGVEWVREVPEHWKVLPLKRNARLLTEKTDSRTNPVALENIQGWTGRLIETETEFQGEGVAFRAGDVLFGKLRPYLAKVYLAPTPGEAVGDFHVIRSGSSLLSRFLQYQLLANEVIDLINGSTYGAKMPRASWSFLGSLATPVPPLTEQPLIASFLDRETVKIDALIAEQQRLIELLQEKRQAVISHAVTKGLNPDAPMKDSGVEWLGEVPEHWEIQKVKHLCRHIEQGWSPQCENEACEGDAPGVLKVGCVNGGIFRPGENKRLPPSLSPIPEYSIRNGDLLVSRANTKELVGSAAVVTQDYPWLFICDKLYRITVDPHLASASFLALYLVSSEVRGQIELGASGASQSMQNISQSVLMELPIALPNLDEQEAIRNAIANECCQIDELVAEGSYVIQLLQERRSALISAAVTGQIDVRGLVPEASAA